jgi:signal peptidase I
LSKRSILKGVAIGFANIAVFVAILYAISFVSPGRMYIMSNEGMAPSIEHMDIVLIKKTPFDSITKGDVVVFVVHSQGKHAISRVVDIKEQPRTLQTQSDNNSTNVHFVTAGDYVGTIYLVIPKIGYLLQPMSLLIIAVVIFIIPSISVPLKAKRKNLSYSYKEYQYNTYNESHDKPNSNKITILVVIIALILFSEFFVQAGGLTLLQQAKPLDLNYNTQKYTTFTSNSLYVYALQIINKDRSDHGLAPVQLSNNISAQKHADDMLQNEYFSHWNTFGVKPYVTYTQTDGRGAMAENIAYEYSYCESVLCPPTSFDPYQQIKDDEYSMMYDDAKSDWGHRDNILDSNHTHVDIGIAYDSNRFYFVEHFENNIIDWQKLDLVNGNQLEMVGTFPAGYSFYSVSIYSDPAPKSLSGIDLDEKPPYNLGHYDAGVITGEIMEQPAFNQNYQECSPGKLLTVSTTGEKNCIDYVTFHNVSKYANGINMFTDVSKWLGHDGLHTIYVILKNKDGKDVEATSLTLEYLK